MSASPTIPAEAAAKTGAIHRTPPAPAEVCERLKAWILDLDNIIRDEDFVGVVADKSAWQSNLLTAALLLIEQGEKERERLDWLEKNGHVAATYRQMPPASDHTSGPYWKINWTHGNEHTVTLRAAIDAARAQPTPESK